MYTESACYSLAADPASNHSNLRTTGLNTHPMYRQPATASQRQVLGAQAVPTARRYSQAGATARLVLQPAGLPACAHSCLRGLGPWVLQGGRCGELDGRLPRILVDLGQVTQQGAARVGTCRGRGGGHAGHSAGGCEGWRMQRAGGGGRSLSRGQRVLGGGGSFKLAHAAPYIQAAHNKATLAALRPTFFSSSIHPTLPQRSVSDGLWFGGLGLGSSHPPTHLGFRFRL